MGSPIIFKDLSGLAEGITQAGGALGQALSFRSEQALKTKKEKEKLEKSQKSIDAITDWAGKYDSTKSPIENVGTLQKALKDKNIDPSLIQPILKSVLEKAISQEGDIFGANQVFNEGKVSSSGIGPTQDQKLPLQIPQVEQSSGIPGQSGNVSEEAQEASALGENVPVKAVSQDRMERFSPPDLVRMAGSPNKIVASTAKAEIEKRKLEQRIDKDDRDWHTKFSIKQEEKVSALRESLPKKNSALVHASQAIQTGQTGIMTGTWLADKTGIEAFRGVEGAQLEVAAKEHFFGNMTRVTAKAQNIFFEKLLKGMFSQVGQTPETAQTFIEMLQGELNMDEAFVNAFDKFSAEDEAIFGYPRKDVERRARQSVEHLEELNMNRTLYRVQRLAESQQSQKKVRENLMKPVSSGTPLTLEKKFMFMDKFNGDARASIKAAKKLGYKIPTGADVHLYMMPNKEFTRLMRDE